MQPNQASIANQVIEKIVANQGSIFFSKKDINQLLRENREDWQVAKKFDVAQLLEQLLALPNFKQIELTSTLKNIVRYQVGINEVPIYTLALSLKSQAFLSHYTAMFLHQLTEQIPKTIYVNSELSPKPKPFIQLSQENIRLAFEKEQRIAQKKYTYDVYTMHLLETKNTGQRGIITTTYLNQNIRITSLERTLIDIAVRPDYAGGIEEVLKAYKNAAENNVSINKLAALLSQLDFIYPYQQVIGFYLERSEAYRPAQIALFCQKPFVYDFYLTYNMKTMDYSEKWKLFYPKGF
jgi:hypothetical protein